MDNGAIVVCLDSANVEDFLPPLRPGWRRRNINAVYIMEEEITRDTNDSDDEGTAENKGSVTVLTFVCNLDFTGLTSSEGKDEVLSFRRHVESILKSGLGHGADTPLAKVSIAEKQASGFHNSPYPATCPDSMYSEPEAASFRLRGVSYLEDGVKVPSAPFLFRLLLIDLFKSKLMTTNICARPDNRVFQAWKRGESDFYFVLNIMVPIKDGHTLSYVAYWKGDPQIFKQSSPFAKIATKFLMVMMTSFAIIDSN